MKILRTPAYACPVCTMAHAPDKPHRRSVAEQTAMGKAATARLVAAKLAADPIGYRVHNWQLEQANRGMPATPEAIEYARVLFADPCCYCGTRYAIGIDHITPRSHGGQTTAENLTAACPSCNSHKSANNILTAVARVQHALFLKRQPALLEQPQSTEEAA